MAKRGRRRRAVSIWRREEMNSLGENGDFGLGAGTDGDGVGKDGRGNLVWIVDDHVETGRVMARTAFHVLVLGIERGDPERERELLEGWSREEEHAEKSYA